MTQLYPKGSTPSYNSTRTYMFTCTDYTQQAGLRLSMEALPSILETLGLIISGSAQS